MKKIVFSGIVWPTDTFEVMELKRALQKFGTLQLDVDEITVADKAPGASFKSIWIYVSPDEDEPYFLASLEGRIDLSEAESDAEISDELMNAIRVHGVCTELVGYYPRADRYGYPAYVADAMKGEALAAFHGFIVTNEQFVATGYDRGDDGAEQMWFKVMVPIEKVNAQLPELS